MNDSPAVGRLTLSNRLTPRGDQPVAIERLVAGLRDGLAHQVLLGVTGSGKTFTMASVIAELNRPALILAHNKTLAAQLYGEMKELFPHNAVEYFVSYYDYYQPEAYLPGNDNYIEKDASINSHIEQMRLAATRSLFNRSDTIIIATVSAIYGLGDPESYKQMTLRLANGHKMEQRAILRRLAEMQYRRNDVELQRGTYRVRGDIIDVFPADEEEQAVRIELFDEQIELLSLFDPLTGKTITRLQRTIIYPKTHYVTTREKLRRAVGFIRQELTERLRQLNSDNKLVEAQRLEQRCLFDLEMLEELGYCSGIENYSRHLSKQKAGDPPACLLNYLPDNALLFVDESHVTIPQLGAMYRGDRSRKETLVAYGFRLPSALDNRPLRFDEFERLIPAAIYVSATPGAYELEHQDQIVEQLVRPTGLLDPEIEIRPVSTQVDDLLSEIRLREGRHERVLVTTLTKRMAEDLSEYLQEHKTRVRYLHSDINTVERVEILRDLRRGVFDVLVGINLLREGLDLPEVSLVAILDADKEGFLRSDRSLIQTMGRAARNLHGRVIMYADKITGSMQRAIDETQRRRIRQQAFNQEHGITPCSIERDIPDIMNLGPATTKRGKKRQQLADKVAEEAPLYASPKAFKRQLVKLEQAMLRHAKDLDFEQAANIRDQIAALRERNFRPS